MMCGVCGVDEEVDEVDGGSSREVRKLVNPQRPSQKEVEAHNLTTCYSAIGAHTA